MSLTRPHIDIAEMNDLVARIRQQPFTRAERKYLEALADNFTLALKMVLEDTKSENRRKTQTKVH